MDRRPYFVGRACHPEDHEFNESADGEQYCTRCEFTYDSLVEVIGQSLDG
jgi:hypothetical protein